MANEKVWKVFSHPWSAWPLSSLRRATNLGPEVFVVADMCVSAGLVATQGVFFEELDAERPSRMGSLYASG
jgi:hypothetical protein